MTSGARATFCAVAPYLAWMALMAFLPPTAGAYAARSAAVAALFAFSLFLSPRAAAPWRHPGVSFAGSLSSGALCGVAVCVLWVFPERFAAYREFSVPAALGLSAAPAADTPSPYDPAVCGAALSWARLAGSAFVIAPVEEVFFRSFVYRWIQKGDWTSVPLSRFDMRPFLWTVALFALEHHTRLAAGAMAGAAYGLLAVRRGMGAAVVAHATTNLLLGLYVMRTGEWGLW